MIEPLIVHGDGNYPLSSVKEIKVTDTFLGLEQRFRKCQTKESLGECTSALLLNKSIEMCGCVPFGLKTLTDGNQESFKLFFLFINTLNYSQFVTMKASPVQRKLMLILVSLHVRESMLKSRSSQLPLSLMMSITQSSDKIMNSTNHFLNHQKV